MNKKTVELLLDDNIKNEDFPNEYYAYMEINNFTLNNGSNKIIYNTENEYFTYKDRSIVFNFKKISDVIKAKYYEKELTSEDRYHKCHIKSVELVPYIPNGKVLTGYMRFGDNKILHSVIEYGKDPMIIDWTINVVMPKIEYLKLTKFKTITIIDAEDIVEDYNIGIIKDIRKDNKTLKVYLLFRDEIINELSKKNKLIK